MKSYTSVLLLLLLYTGCGKKASTKEANNYPRLGFTIESFQYEPMSIPLFFESLVSNHLLSFATLDSTEYSEFCSSNNTIKDDSINISRFYTLKIIHELFTSEDASNGSRGKILNIPYYWHWVNPNPRYEIQLIDLKAFLKDVKAPREFSKYHSFADIDRTPYLFLSELFFKKPKYYSTIGDTFSTFGWCSEREMAFVSLLEIMKYEGKVIAEGNHSWSEFIVSMISKNNALKNFRFKVDNTFDKFQWEEIKPEEIENWKNYQGNSSQSKWYNEKAHSINEKQKIKEYVASPEAMIRIENLIVEYLNRINPST